MINYLESHDEERLMGLLKPAGLSAEQALRKAKLAMTLLMTLPGEPMLLHGEEWGEDTPKTTEPNKLRWEKRETPEGRALLDHARAMCRLRRSRPSLMRHYFQIDSIRDDARCFVFRRGYGVLDQVVAAFNLSEQRRTISVSLPVAGVWREFFSGETADRPSAFDAELEPLSAKIFCIGVS